MSKDKDDDLIKQRPAIKNWRDSIPDDYDPLEDWSEDDPSPPDTIELLGYDPDTDPEFQEALAEVEGMGGDDED